jgi:hypothetical protein
VERRLTATLQLQPSSTTVPGVRAEPKPRGSSRKRTLRGPGGAAIGSSSALRLPAAAFSAANRARDVTSGALCRDPPLLPVPLLRVATRKGAGPRRRAARPAWAAVSSKTAACAGPGRLPSPRTPSASGTVACAARSLGIMGSLPFRTASLPFVPTGSLSHACNSSPRAPRRYRREVATALLHPFAQGKSPLCARQNRAGKLPSRAWGVGARPVPEGMDPAPLVDFCNQNSPRAQPRISRSPSGALEVALLRAVRVALP